MVAYGQFTISVLSDGTSVESVTVQYYLSTSRTQLIGGSWGTTCPAVSDGHYVWTRTGIKLSDSNTVSYSQAACITGDKGQTGSSGQGIVSVTPMYIMNESKETVAQPPTGWTDDPSTLTWESGKYIWTTSKIVYRNPSSTVYTTPSCDTAWEAANAVQDNLNAYITTNDQAVSAQAQTLASHTSSINSISSTVDQHTNQIASKVSQTDFNSSITGLENDIDKSTGINKWLVEIYLKTSLPEANRTLYNFAAFAGSGINPTSSGTYLDANISKSFLTTKSYIGYALTFVNVTTQFTWTHGFSASGNGRLYVNGSQVSGTTVTMKVGWNVVEVIWNVGTTTPNGFAFTSKLGTNSNVLLMNCYHRTITGREASEVTRTSELLIGLNGITSRVSSAESNINTNAGNINTLNTNVSTVTQTANKINWLVTSQSSSSSVTLTDAAVTAVTNQFVIKDPDGSATVISGGRIQANSITAGMLAANAIKSQNYRTYNSQGQQVTDGAPYNSPYSTFGTLLDLSTGSIYTPNFGVDNANGNAYLNGEIIATSGKIGGESGTYWEISPVEEDSVEHAAIISNGNAFINTGQLTIKADRINSQSVDAQKNLVYPSYNNRYYDFGVHVPELNPAKAGYIQGVSDDFLYIRYHDNTVPELESDWNYVFRVDKDGMIYINGNSLDQKYASIDGVSGAYLPRTGGTITQDLTVEGNLTVKGNLTGNASSASQLNNAITVNGRSFNGSSSVDVGTIGVAYGGTGNTSWTAGGIIYASSADTLGQISSGTSGQILKSNGNTAPGWVNQSSIAAGSATKDSAGHTISSYYAPLSGATFTGDVIFTEGATFSGATFTGDVVFTEGVTVGQTFDAIEATVGDLMVTGAARFINGLYGDLIGNANTATTADKVGSNLVILLNSGTTEGTNKFTYNGSATKNVNITKSSIGLGNVENTALSTWAGSANLTTTKVGTLAAAAVKDVDTSISDESTSVNLPTSEAVVTFVEGKGYVTSSGVTSVRVQATSPVVSSVNTAQSSTLNTTISLANAYGDTKNPYGTKTKNYVLAGPSSGDAAAPTFRALVAADIPTLTPAKAGLGNVTNDKQVKGLSSGTTSGHLVSWGANGYTVADSGIAKTSIATKLTLAGTDYAVSSNAITVTQANLQSAVQSTNLVLMTADERSKLSSIQVSEGGTIDFSGVTASSPLTATVGTDKTVNITHNTSGVSAGTYRSVTVNTYGHVTGGTNPTTLSGYGITDAKIASGTITLGSNTITPLTASSTLDATKLSGTASISTTGNAGTATKFSSKRSIALTGDVIGSASTDGSSGWSIATEVQDDSHNHTYDTIVPLETKTYTGWIGTASNNAANDSFYYMKVRPTGDFYNQWSIRYRVTATIPGQNNYHATSDVTLYGYGQATAPAYHIFNTQYSSSYRPYLYHNFYRLTADGYSDGLSNAVGLGLRGSNSRNTAGYERTVKIEVISTLNCTFELLDEGIKWASWTGNTTENYAGLTEYNGYDAGLQETGDANNNTYDKRYLASTQLRAGINGIKSWGLIMQDSDGNWQSLTTTSGNTVVHTKNPSGFLPRTIFRYNTSNNIAANALCSNNYVYETLDFDFRYSSNCAQTLTARKSVYLVGTMVDGYFYLDDTWYSQELPTTADGKVYIYLGEASSGYQVTMVANHPMYQFKNDRLVEYVDVTKTDIGLSNVDNTADANKNVLTATKFSSARTIQLTGDATGSASSDGTNGWSITTSVNHADAADSATKATQDSDGHTITSYYVTLSTAQTVSGAKTFSGATAITNTTASTNKSTGALKVSGGVGVAGQMSANKVMVGDAVVLQFNTSTNSLDFIFN